MYCNGQVEVQLPEVNCYVMSISTSTNINTTIVVSYSFIILSQSSICSAKVQNGNIITKQIIVQL